MGYTSDGKKKRRVFKSEDDNTVLAGFKFKYKYIGASKHRRKVIVCQYEGCNKTFGKSWNFRDHALMHEGIKPYVCKICRKSFTQKGNLKKHCKVHTELNVPSQNINGYNYSNGYMI